MSHLTQSLRFKLTLLVIAVELLIFSGVGVFYTQRFSQEIDNAIIARLSVPGLLMTRGELSFEAVSDKRTMEGLLREPYSEGVVIGLDGRVYFSSDPALLEKHLNEIDGLKFPGPASSAIADDAPDLIMPVRDGSGTYLTCLSALRPDGKLTGYLYLKVGTAVSEAEKNKIAMLFAIGSLGTIIFTAAILSWLLHLMVNKRLNYLVEIFRRFALGDYATRAQLLGGDDEIATLMNGFNGLARRLEEAMADLHDSEQRYRMVFENSPISIWEEDFSEVKRLFDGLKMDGVADIETYFTQHPETVRQCADLARIVAVNRAALTLHGAKSEQELLVGMANTFTPESFDTFMQELVCLWSGRTVMTRDAVVKTLAGEPRYVTVYFSVCSGYEETLAKVIVSLTDITERKRTEDALRLSSERLQLATRSAHIGIWDWDIPRNELVWDDSMYQLYGIQKGDFGGAYDAWIRTLHPEDKAYTDGEIQAALRGEREYAPEFRIVRPDGSIRHIKADSRTTRDSEGKPLRMIGTNIDITEHKQVEAKIRTINQELEQRVAERTAQLETAVYDLENFNYSASHDLRIPLRAVDGFSRILLDEYSGVLDAEGMRLLQVVRDNTKRMAQYIEDMLTFSSIGRMAASPSWIDMEALAHEVAEELKAAESGRELIFKIDKLPSVFADQSMMRRVLANLLANAIKFTRPRPSALIEVGAKADRGETIYYVRDNGVGFDMRYTDKLFGVFQRLHSVEEFEGNGIGLAIVKRIVTRHGGRVWAEGKVGEGATFYFSLPHHGIS
jgi:PAS domain S-box-containing protein